MSMPTKRGDNGTAYRQSSTGLRRTQVKSFEAKTARSKKSTPQRKSSDSADDVMGIPR